MSQPAAEPIAVADGVRYYTVVCLAALFATTLPLLARGLEAWSFFPCLVGCVAVAARWRWGFFLVMVALLWIVIADKVGMTPWALAEYLVNTFVQLFATHRLYTLPRAYAIPRFQAEQPVLDILHCLSMVAFAAAFLRLISLTRSIFPVDRRRRTFGFDQNSLLRRLPVEEKRSPGLVERTEMASMLMGIAVLAIVAELFWVWLSERDSLSDLSFTIQDYEEFLQALRTRSVPVRIPNGIWRMLLVLWIFFLAIVPVVGVLSYLGLRRATAAEAALFLQDCLWRETRREQARNNRWLAWAERKYERKQAARELKRDRRSRRVQ